MHPRTSRAGARALACATLLGLATAAAPALATDGLRLPYPDDPLAHDREPLRTVEIGSARGQTRLTALGALVNGKNSDDTYLGGQLGIEFQLHEFGAVRINGFQDLVEPDGSRLRNRFSSMRVGPALHLRPYRRIDFGPYTEAGLLLVDAVNGRRGDKGVEVVMGGFITIHLDSHVFVQLELERAWSTLEVDGVLDDQHRTAAKLGLGLAF